MARRAELKGEGAADRGRGRRLPALAHSLSLSLAGRETVCIHRAELSSASLFFLFSISFQRPCLPVLFI